MKLFDFVTDPNQARIDDIKRFNGFNPLKIESVSQHSYWVSVFTTVLLHEMFPIPSPINNTIIMRFKLEVLNFSIFHDYVENITGDVVHDLKYNTFNGTEIKSAISEYERYIISKLISESEETRTAEHVYNTVLYNDEFGKSIVKLADWLACAKAAYIEIKLGNTLFDKVTELIGKKTIAHIEILSKQYEDYCKDLEIPVTEILPTLIENIKQNF